MRPSLHVPKLAVFTCWLLLLTACKKDPSASNDTNPPVLRDSLRNPLPAPTSNKPPVADAGADQVITLPVDSTRLSGKGTDADGTIVSYEWYITAYHARLGQYVYYSYTTPEVTLKNLQEGVLWCALKVTDNGGLADIARVTISVVSPGCPCYPDPCDAFGDPCDPWDY